MASLFRFSSSGDNTGLCGLENQISTSRCQLVEVHHLRLPTRKRRRSSRSASTWNQYLDRAPEKKNHAHSSRSGRLIFSSGTVFSPYSHFLSHVGPISCQYRKYASIRSLRPLSAFTRSRTSLALLRSFAAISRTPVTSFRSVTSCAEICCMIVTQRARSITFAAGGVPDRDEMGVAKSSCSSSVISDEVPLKRSWSYESTVGSLSTGDIDFGADGSVSWGR